MRPVDPHRVESPAITCRRQSLWRRRLHQQSLVAPDRPPNRRNDGDHQRDRAVHQCKLKRRHRLASSVPEPGVLVGGSGCLPNSEQTVSDAAVICPRSKSESPPMISLSSQSLRSRTSSCWSSNRSIAIISMQNLQGSYSGTSVCTAQGTELTPASSDSRTTSCSKASSCLPSPVIRALTFILLVPSMSSLRSELSVSELRHRL